MSKEEMFTQSIRILTQIIWNNGRFWNFADFFAPLSRFIFCMAQNFKGTKDRVSPPLDPLRYPICISEAIHSKNFTYVFPEIFCVHSRIDMCVQYLKFSPFFPFYLILITLPYILLYSLLLWGNFTGI